VGTIVAGTEWTTGAAILAQAGAAPASPDVSAWADSCAAAVNGAIDYRVVGADPGDDPTYTAGMISELTRAALVAGVLAFKAREANVDAQAPAIVGDYLEPIEGIVARWATFGFA